MDAFSFPNTEPTVGSLVVNFGTICKIVERMDNGYLKAAMLNQSGRRLGRGFTTLAPDKCRVVQINGRLDFNLYFEVVKASEVAR